jgi:hypothetical protein
VPGVHGWDPAWAKRLAGRRVVIALDCDSPGREAAERIASDLVDHAAEVRVLDLDPSRDDGYDLGDLLLEAAEHGADGLLDLRRLLERMAAAAEVDVSKPDEVIAPDTADVLDEITALVEKYVVLPSEAETIAIALWVAHTWALDGAHATPYLLVTSPEKRSGKSRLLEVLELLARRPWRVASASEAAMFRKISEHRPTLLLDEIDAIFGSASERTEPLRAVLNAGNRPGSNVARCVGDGAKQTVVDFSVYCPKALAGIDTGRVPDTITDRSIRLAMKRKTSAEPAAGFRHRYADAEARPIREALEAWGAAHAEELLLAEPDLPAGLDDRAAEAWEPLVAIAELAGGDVPARARAAALALIGDEGDEPGHGARLLAKLREVFDDEEVLATTTILAEVNGDDELPFGGWRHGDGLDPRGLARLLKPYGVKRRTIRLGDQTAKGYRRDQFEEPWARYLPPTPQNGSQGSHRSQPAPGLERDVTLVTDVTDISEEEAA